MSVHSLTISRSVRHLARSATGSIHGSTNVQDATSGLDSLTEPLLADHSVHYDSIYDSSEFTNQRNNIELMRKRLRYHFMSPYQKFRHRGRKPWKVFMQLLKLVVVTVQIFIFGSELFSVVNYMEDTTQSFNTLFLGNSNSSNLYIYTKAQFYSQAHHALEQYYNIHTAAFGMYASAHTDGGLISPMEMCILKYQKGTVDPSNETYTFNRKIHYPCSNLTPFDEHENITSFVKRNHLPTQFTSIISIRLSAKVRSLHLKSPPHKPDCYEFNVSIMFDNHNHNGKVPVSLMAESHVLTCNGTLDDEGDLRSLKAMIFAFDIIVILTCSVSAALCLRSLVKHMRLVWATQRFFREQLMDHLSYWHCLDLMNLWYLLILISDFCTILGSLFKILIDQTLFVSYTTSSIFLGVGVLLTWSGLLRFLGYLRKYNVLLVTLRASSPSVLRFCVCASLLYFGYLFCGWIVLGPYHKKFRDLLVVSECLFSLINGDDMFMTFAELQLKSGAVWIFSKIYLYTFISLFIYVILSLFIGIISDTYERIKDWGHPPCTKLERFVHGNNCKRCAAENRAEEQNGVDAGSAT